VLEEIVDPLRLLLLRHPVLHGLSSDDTGEPPPIKVVPNRLYVYESDDADLHDLAGVGPQDREVFEVFALLVAPNRGEGIVLKPGRVTSLWLDRRREAIAEVVRRNRSRWGTAEWCPPPGDIAGNPTPWQHLQARADIRYARYIDTRAAAVRISGWRILPNENL
jgi:hypothetical protein